MTRTPPLAPFTIFDACRQGFYLMADNASLIARMAVIPLMIVCINAAMIGAAGGVTPLKGFIFGLPSFAATAWMIFLCVRLWMLGEIPTAPVDAPHVRRQMLQTTIVTYMLWKALTSAYDQVMITVVDPMKAIEDPAAYQGDTGLQLLLMALLGVLLWALRFRVVPVLAAVGYPLGDYARRATGFMLSLRLLALVLICVEFPRMLILSPLAAGTVDSIIVLLIGNALTFVLEIWLFASFTAALKTMMKTGRTP